ncbi:hypothetical protein ACOMHN_024574 [Nucella lapillus]
MCVSHLLSPCLFCSALLCAFPKSQLIDRGGSHTDDASHLPLAIRLPGMNRYDLPPHRDARSPTSTRGLSSAAPDQARLSVHTLHVMPLIQW